MESCKSKPLPREAQRFARRDAMWQSGCGVWQYSALRVHPRHFSEKVWQYSEVGVQPCRFSEKVWQYSEVRVQPWHFLEKVWQNLFATPCFVVSKNHSCRHAITEHIAPPSYPTLSQDESDSKLHRSHAECKQDDASECAVDASISIMA